MGQKQTTSNSNNADQLHPDQLHPADIVYYRGCRCVVSSSPTLFPECVCVWSVDAVTAKLSLIHVLRSELLFVCLAVTPPPGKLLDEMAFSRLPVDVFATIMRLLPAQDRVSLSLTCANAARSLIKFNDNANTVRDSYVGSYVSVGRVGRLSRLWPGVSAHDVPRNLKWASLSASSCLLLGLTGKRFSLRIVYGGSYAVLCSRDEANAIMFDALVDIAKLSYCHSRNMQHALLMGSYPTPNAIVNVSAAFQMMRENFFTWLHVPVVPRIGKGVDISAILSDKLFMCSMDVIENDAHVLRELGIV
jgi:hypothetical protein